MRKGWRTRRREKEEEEEKEEEKMEEKEEEKMEEKEKGKEEEEERMEKKESYHSVAVDHAGTARAGAGAGGCSLCERRHPALNAVRDLFDSHQPFMRVTKRLPHGEPLHRGAGGQPALRRGSSTLRSEPVSTATAVVVALGTRARATWLVRAGTAGRRADVDCARRPCAATGHLLPATGRTLQLACVAERLHGALHERVEEIPWYIAVRNIRAPQAPRVFLRDDTRNYTCFNGATAPSASVLRLPARLTGHRRSSFRVEHRSDHYVIVLIGQEVGGATELAPARFGGGDSLSSALFSVTDPLGADLAVSLFLRTRRPAGPLLAVAPGNGSAGGPYLRVWLEGGKVKVEVDGSQRLESRGALGDGERHFVRVEVGGARGGVTLFVGEEQQGHAPQARPLDVRAGARVAVGGLQEEGPGPGSFKGCVQDLRINGRRLRFFSPGGASARSFSPGGAPARSFPLEAAVNVSEGCTGDDACLASPCLNGGQCLPLWDHFTCTCPSHTAGRRCEEVRWCEAAPCPAGAVCHPLHQGFECLSNVTLLNDSSVLSYRGRGLLSRDVASLTLSLRTRRRHAALLHAERGSAFITLSLQDGRLCMELQSPAGGGEEGEEGEGEGEEEGEEKKGEEEEEDEQEKEEVEEEEEGKDEEGVEDEEEKKEEEEKMEEKEEEKMEEKEELSTVSLTSRRLVSDGEWHSVHLFMAAPWARRSRWTLVLDEDLEGASTSAAPGGGNLNFLRRGVDIFLGGLGPGVGWGLVGCLGPVELGGVALPYFGPAQLGAPRPQAERFELTSAPPARRGCGGGAVCEPDPCLNGGRCRDLFDLHRCECPEGWAGRRCGALVDTCASAPCLHGNCSVVAGSRYACACHVGFAGPDCREEADVCEAHLCGHGATCLHGPGRYACLCAENYTGPLCNERVEEIPWYIAVRNIRPPKLPVSFCGDDTRNYTCFNGGNCTERQLSCDCRPGFTGHRCEQEVDECKSNPCLNGGYCRNLINKFSCVCDMSFTGAVCQTDVSDLYFYVAVLLWQNLFQLLSYLILRLDEDEPEVDWGAEE
ncbi:unnamed protein product [Arctogadus glacialis]